MLLAAFPLSALILGIINIAIVVAVLILVGYIIVWFCSTIGFPIPDMVQKLFMIVVALIALYMLVALLLGLPVPGLTGPPFRIFARAAAVPWPNA